ncbi:MAG: hypothetical protein LBB72_04315 [Spirochaetaceae bacterium]|nr:hypothetical protein [Spirochaetaceae bacterium]
MRRLFSKHSRIPGKNERPRISGDTEQLDGKNIAPQKPLSIPEDGVFKAKNTINCLI